MAQWKDRPFDDVTQRRLETAIELARLAAGAWADGGLAAIDPDRFIALLLLTFSGASGVAMLIETTHTLFRRLEGVGSPADELARFRGSRFVDVPLVLAGLRALVNDAARAWAGDGRTAPPPEQVIRDVSSALHRHGLLRTPPRPMRDDGAR